ncbi:MAG: addiction module protein [Crocinitomicaceae bacterium]|nr:addiction module protein [Flavobacteriales bacterium]NQZ36880.1 addiction module protein [Crocinitomicaceae bacterium]
MELFHNLGLDTSEHFDIPQWQKDEVAKRIKDAEENPDRLLNWEDAKQSFKFD